MLRLSPAPKAFLEEPATQTFMVNLFNQIGPIPPASRWFIVIDTETSVILDFFPLVLWHTETPLGRQS